MTAKNRINILIDKYNTLSVADQTVLQALSVLHLPASAVLVASCLSAAGCRESPLRAFSPQNVAVRLAGLAKAGLAAETMAETENGKNRLWSAKPEVGEVATRHAVRDGRFLPLAKAALAETRGRDWRGDGADDSVERRARINFHAGNWQQTLAELTAFRRESPGEAGAFFARLVRNQPDDSWKGKIDKRVFGEILALCLMDVLAGLADPAPLDAILKDFAAKDNPNPQWDDALAALGNALAFQGRLPAAVKLSDLAALEDTRLWMRVGPAVLNADPDVRDAAEAAMAARRGRIGGREQLPDGAAAVWYALAVMAADDPASVGAMLKRLSGQAARDHELAGALFCLRHAFLFMDGQAHSARALPDAPPDSHPLTVLMHGLAMLRIDPSRLETLRPGLAECAARAKRGGYRRLAEELSFAAPDGAGASGGTENHGILHQLFSSHDEWRRGLKALDDLALGEEIQDEQQRKRLAWLVDFPAHPENPFCPVAIQPVEQSIGKDGQWSKGRNIALRRIFQRRNDLLFATDQDKMIFLTLAYEFDGPAQGYVFDIQAALPLLIGHPQTFRGDAGGAKMEVVAGEFELTVADRNGGCEISLEPPLSEFLVAGEGAVPIETVESGNGAADDEIPEENEDGELPTSRPLDVAGMDLPETAARLETPTRLRVYRLSDREKRLVQVVGGGLAIPPAGREEALRTMSRLAGKVRIQSDIPELAGDGEMTDSDPRPRFHVMPQNPGLKIEAWAHPLGDSGPAYRPARGGRIISADVDGRTIKTVRNLKIEKELIRDAVAACPSLAGHEEGELSWRLENPETALSFLAETEELGDRAVLSWPKGGRFRVRKVRGGPGALALRVNTGADWFEVEGGLRIDENLVIDMDKLLAAAGSSPGRFIPLGDGDFLALTEDLRRQIADLTAFGERHGGMLRIPALAAGVLEEMEELGADLRADAEWRAQLERRKALANFRPEPPAGFRADLRAYQLEGYQWMARLAELGAGACLADDMGLGKTVQALALLIRRASLGPALVVAPTSVVHNWMSETRRFAPDLRMTPFRDSNRAEQIAALRPGDVLISSYSLLRQEEKNFAAAEWATVVLDEAQAIKNIAAKRSRAAMTLKAGFRLITTGTPIENHLGELWNLFRFINPRLLGSARRFQERFAVPIERENNKEAGERLRRIIRPFILRRTKTQVLDSLPPKTEITLAVELGDKERAFYESLRRGALERLESEPSPAENKRFQILAEIMRLRRACCSPQLVSGDHHVASAKQAEFHRILTDLVDNGHKALVFSQFVDHLSIIRRHLDKIGFSYQYLDGSTPVKKRKQAVEEFQSGHGDVFLISLKAGGLGLNLTAADYVIHMDPWWNPAVEDQASDRAHRIGQDKPVTVYRLVAANTIEEKIVELHKNKRDLADTLLAGSDQASGMDIDEMMRLLREG